MKYLYKIKCDELKKDIFCIIQLRLRQLQVQMAVQTVAQVNGLAQV